MRGLLLLVFSSKTLGRVCQLLLSLSAHINSREEGSRREVIIYVIPLQLHKGGRGNRLSDQGWSNAGPDPHSARLKRYLYRALQREKGDRQ